MSDNIIIFGQEVSSETAYFNMVWLEEIHRDELLKLKQLKQLRHLNASFYKLNDVDLEVIGQLKSVELLDLVMTEVTDEGLKLLRPMVNLEELRLKDNPQITDAGLEHLSGLKNLKLIHLGNTSVTIAGLQVILRNIALSTLVIDSDFKESLNELGAMSLEYPSLEIIVKGTATVSNGEIY